MAVSNSTNESFDEELDWIRIKAELAHSNSNNTPAGKMKSLILSNPFVPLGCLSTVGALGLGLKNFYRGNHRKQQLYMRARVGAQGFTVLALVGGVFYEAFKH